MLLPFAGSASDKQYQIKDEVVELIDKFKRNNSARLESIHARGFKLLGY